MLGSHYSAQWGNVSQTIAYIDELPAGERAQFDMSNRNLFNEPLMRFWYGFQKIGFSPEAERYVDNLLARSDLLNAQWSAKPSSTEAGEQQVEPSNK